MGLKGVVQKIAWAESLIRSTPWAWFSTKKEIIFSPQSPENCEDNGISKR
jgi:hypothetical protein